MDRFFKTTMCWLLAVLFFPSGTHLLGTTLIEGDVYIELVASVYFTSHDNGTCSDVDAESLENVEAVRWVITELNKHHISNKNKGIGLRVSRTCGSVVTAENLMLDLIIEMKSSVKQTVIGVLGMEYTSETDAASRLLSALPAQYRLPLISYSTTAESLSNKAVYRNFLRTIPSDAIQTKVMTSFMKKLNWTRMAIIYDDNAYGRGGKEALLKEAMQPDICFPVAIAVKDGENRQQDVEAKLLDTVFNASIPIHGILIFGRRDLADAVLVALENRRETYPNASSPELLFSEASGELQHNITTDYSGWYVLSPPRRNMSEFYESYTNIFKSPQSIYNLREPYKSWMKDLYFSKFGCQLPTVFFNNACPPLTDAEITAKVPQSVYDQYAIQAALTLATIERNVRQKLCQNNDFCSTLSTSPRQVYMEQIEQLSVNFDSLEGVRISAFRDPVDLVIEFNDSADAAVSNVFPVYEVYHHQRCDNVSNLSCLIKVADMNSDGIALSTSRIKDYDEEGNERYWPNIRKPQCPDGFTCSACIKQTNFDDSIIFEPGDMYIVGVVPIHNQGTSPLECGGIASGNLDIAEAMRFAVTEAKNIYENKVPAGKVGTIIIDSCNDQQIVQEIIISLHRLGIYNNGQYIPVADKILGYVGGLTSDVSTTIAEIMTRLGYAQISYASTATNLSIRPVYPNFLRIPSSDALQAKEMLKVVKAIGANLIQIIHSDSIYGENGKYAVIDRANSMDICITQILKVSRDNNSLDMINALRKTKEAMVVVLFLSAVDFERLLPSLNAGLSKGEFIFMGSDQWGLSFDVSDYRNLVGSITLTTELPENEKFKSHLKDLRPDGIDANHWIRPYMESTFRCYYQWSFNKSSNSACTGDETLDAYNTNYRVNIWAPFAERAVLSLLQAAKVVLDNTCGGSTNVCGNFHEDPSLMVRAIKEVTFNDDSGNQAPIVDGNGDGKAGYRFYVLEMANETVIYNKVGATDPAFSFDLASYTQYNTVVSSCTAGQAICQRCYPTAIQGDDATLYPVWLIVLFVIVLLVCVALAICIGFYCYRRGCCFRMENGRVQLVSEYLTAVYRKDPSNLKERVETGNYNTIDDLNRDQHEYTCIHCKHCPSCNNVPAEPASRLKTLTVEERDKQLAGPVGESRYISTATIAPPAAQGRHQQARPDYTSAAIAAPGDLLTLPTVRSNYISGAAIAAPGVQEKRQLARPVNGSNYISASIAAPGVQERGQLARPVGGSNYISAAIATTGVQENGQLGRPVDGSSNINITIDAPEGLCREDRAGRNGHDGNNGNMTELKEITTEISEGATTSTTPINWQHHRNVKPSDS